MDALRLQGVASMMGWICAICGASVAPQIETHCGPNEAFRAPQTASSEHVVALGSKPSTKASTKNYYTHPHFAAFWDAYPRKVGKEAAARSFRRIVGRVSPQIVIEAASKYASTCARNQTEMRFIPYPQKWLNDGRYWDTDDAPPAANEGDPSLIVGTPEYAARIQAEEDAAIEAMS